MKTQLVKTKNEINYGVLTDVSKGINEILGDKTGRTVSRRTTHGFKKAFNLNDISDDNAEHIVHGGMVAAATLLTKKNDGAKVAGLLLLFGLFACYHNGK